MQNQNQTTVINPNAINGASRTTQYFARKFYLVNKTPFSNAKAGVPSLEKERNIKFECKVAVEHAKSVLKTKDENLAELYLVLVAKTLNLAEGDLHLRNSVPGPERRHRWNGSEARYSDWRPSTQPRSLSSNRGQLIAA